jgi:hypothetical protein
MVMAEWMDDKPVTAIRTTSRLSAEEIEDTC